MNVKQGGALFAWMLLLLSNSADATVSIILNPSESQVSTSAAADVSLTVIASSDKAGGTDLTVGAGYTLTCEQGLGEHKEDTANTFSNTPANTSKSVTAADVHFLLVP